MASVIKLKRSTDTGVVPANGQLQAGELAINLADKKLFSSADGTNIITISGDQYNVVTSGNSTQGQVILTVDNAALSNDTLIFTGSGGTVVAGNSTQITVDSTTYVVSTTGNSTIGQIVLTPSGGGDGTTETLAIVGGSGVTVGGNSTQITVSAVPEYIDLSAGGNTTTGVIILSNNDGLDDQITFQGSNNIVVSNTGATTISVSLQDAVSTVSLDLTGAVNSTSNTTGSLTVAGGAGFGKSVTVGEDLTVYGNLTIIGAATEINSTVVTIDDSSLKLADNQADTTTFTDTVDFGFYGEYGNTSVVAYSGIFRDASANVFVVVNSIATEPGTTITYTAANSTSSGNLGQIDAIIDGGTYA
tara:strand:+ start:9554 stop:10633 length:1080 start_codon:yes stop_codon:yes gene_type:complete